MKRKKLVISFILLSSLIFVSAYNTNNTQGAATLANLVFKTAGGGSWTDYGLFVAQYLRDIGVDIEVKVVEWSVFVGDLVSSYDFDMAFVGLIGGGATPDMRDVFTETGSLNAFGIKNDIPYCDVSEEMQTVGVAISDLDERQQHYYDWQQLMMDKIVPCLPFYAPRSYFSLWSTIEGYDVRWGFIDSSPYMSYNGYHEGQDSLDEWNIADAMWSELNPLFTDDTSSSYIFNLGDEQIIQFSPDQAPLKTGLVEDWEQIDEFHYKLTMRDNIFWNPSFNVTERTSSDDPLVTETSPGVWEVTDPGLLIPGLKDGTVSDGTNQQVTAKDAVFTYLAWASPIVSESPTYHDWISDIYVDPVDPLVFHVHIDANPGTPDPDPYADFWARLPWRILPEFYLNSSDPTVSTSSGGVETTGFYAGIADTPEWVAYSDSPFGCGKFMLDYYVKNSVTTLTRSPFWFGVGAIDGASGLAPFVEHVNIRVIPDNSAALVEFKAGKLDIMGVTSFPQERKQMQVDPRYEVQSLVQDEYEFLIYNMRRPFLGGLDNYEYLTDVPGKEEYTRACAVRKALSYAIDREEINVVTHDGEYQLAHSTIYPYTAFYYYNDIIKYYRDLDAAVEWITAAGYDLGIEETPMSIFSVIAALGAAIVAGYFYRKKK